MVMDLNHFAAGFCLAAILVGLSPALADSVLAPGEEAQEDDWVLPGGTGSETTADTAKKSKIDESDKEDPNARHEVIVTCSDPELVQGLTVYAVKVGDGFVPTKANKPKLFGADGKATMRVPDGRFVFETLALNLRGECVALSSQEYSTPLELPAPTQAAKPAQITLQVDKPRKLAFTVDGKPMPITKSWVRMVANAECQWDNPDPSKAPVVYTSPGAEYMVRVSGEEAAVLAVKWAKVQPGQAWDFDLDSKKMSLPGLSGYPIRTPSRKLPLGFTFLIRPTKCRLHLSFG